MRAVIVLVHGLFSSPGVWASFGRLLSSDVTITDRFDLDHFDYYTPWFRLDPRRQIPDFDIVAAGLETFLAGIRDRHIVIITHSQGGLVVQRFMARLLWEGRARELQRISGFVMFACPNSGSEFALTTRRMLKIWHHPQERELRPLARSILETQRVVLQRVVYATETSDTRCPVPVVAYAGQTDGVVSPASAMAVFPDVRVLPGDHFSIIQPNSHSDPAYVALRSDLLSFFTAHNRIGAAATGRVDDARNAGSVKSLARSPLPTVSAGALAAIVDALLLIDELLSGPSRRQVISFLPPHIRSVVPDADTPRLHLAGTIRTCIRFGDYGRDALTEALVLGVGDQPQLAVALETMRSQWPSGQPG